jgi:hypothetical protein
VLERAVFADDVGVSVVVMMTTTLSEKRGSQPTHKPANHHTNKYLRGFSRHMSSYLDVRLLASQQWGFASTGLSCMLDRHASHILNKVWTNEHVLVRVNLILNTLQPTLFGQIMTHYDSVVKKGVGVWWCKHVDVLIASAGVRIMSVEDNASVNAQVA